MGSDVGLFVGSQVGTVVGLLVDSLRLIVGTSVGDLVRHVLVSIAMFWHDAEFSQYIQQLDVSVSGHIILTYEHAA